MDKNMRIILATQNSGKLKEFSSIAKLACASVNFEIKPIANDIGDIHETGDNYLDNALIKAETVYAFYHSPVLSDDSGLELIDFNNIPGVYSARFAGISANDGENRSKLCEFMTSNSVSSTPARYRCLLIYKPDVASYFKFEAIWDGVITTDLRGHSGFGYDPMFIPNGFRCTAAELDNEVKNKVSHRAKALFGLFKFLGA